MRLQVTNARRRIIKLLRTEYQIEHGKPVVYLFLRDNGKRIIQTDDSLVPYFYIPHGENVCDKVFHTGKTYTTFDGQLVEKVECKIPGEVRDTREHFTKTYEADVLFATRYLIDKVDKLDYVKPKVLYLDIETENHGRVPKPTVANEPIVCVSFYDDLEERYTTFTFRSDLAPGTQDRIFNERIHETVYYKTEADMLRGIIQYIKDSEPDVITGWNLSLFDMPYLYTRMKNMSLHYEEMSPMGVVNMQIDKGLPEVTMKGIAIVDLYVLYRHFTFNIEESYKLGYIAQKVLGTTKKDMDVTRIHWYWKNKLQDLIDYNLTDVKLTHEINEKRNLIEFTNEIRRLAFCQLEDSIISSKCIDSFVLRLFHNQMVFPTKIKHERAKFEGAIVNRWVTGLQDNIAVFDLKSLYPNVIQSFNLSPESFESSPQPNQIVVNEYLIRTDKEGYLPKVVRTLLTERFRYKALAKKAKLGSEEYKLYDNQQMALKILTNAVYGQTAYPNSRIFDSRVAETTTYIGRQIITWSRNYIESLGYKVCYCDTDSLFWQYKDLDNEGIVKVQQSLNNSYIDFVKEYGLKSHSFEMEFEKIYRKAFWGESKKRYAGHLVWKNGQNISQLETTGFETKRSDTSEISKKIMTRLFEMLLIDDKPKDEILKYIGDEIERIRQGNYRFTELGIPKGISKDLDEYDHPGANIRGAKYMDELGIELSSKPKLLYVSKVAGDAKTTDVICFDDESQIPAGTEIDIEKMLTKLIKDKLDGIFDALNWDIKDLQYHWRRPKKKGGEQLSLFG